MSVSPLIEARARHALYDEIAANRLSWYTVRMAYSQAADRELRRIKRLEQEERRRKTASTATVDAKAANHEMVALALSGVLSRRR